MIFHMKLFAVTLQWDQAIIHSFDQDDVKCVGHQRVESELIVAAEDQELAELFLKRELHHHNPQILRVEPRPLHMVVTTHRLIATHGGITGQKKVGPEVLNEFGKATEKERSRT